MSTTMVVQSRYTLPDQQLEAPVHGKNGERGLAVQGSENARIIEWCGYGRLGAPRSVYQPTVAS